VFAVAVHQFLCLKDLAQMLQLHPRSVKRLYRRLGVPPTIEAHACHRWSPEDAERLIEAWKEHCKKKLPTNGH
jgi:hypothetical protein